MESNHNNSNSHESQPSGPSNTINSEKPMEKDVFVNHAEIAWQNMRKEWVGDRSSKSQRTPREPVILSWTTTYEDLLLSTEPFQQPIPLAISQEMVDFLVDIWQEDGLYD